MNNRISLFINVLLAAGVIVLFYLHFNDSRRIDAANTAATKKDTTPQLKFDIPKNLQGSKVLYVNIDSIDAGYEAFSDLSKQAGNNYNYKLNLYQQRALDLQTRYEALQSKSQMGTISADDAAKEEAAINAGMDELKKMEAELNYLQNDAMQKNNTITAQISAYFKEYSRSKGIDFIFGTGQGSNVLFANDSLDITKEVLEALNQNYRANKVKPSK